MEKLTILMPVKNGEKFLPYSIQDIETNVEEIDEIIVVNDGSSDRTGQILDRWSKENHLVKILDNPNPGLVNSLNLGMRESSNNWIARFDVDDRYPSNRLMLQRKRISDNVAAIFCDYEFFYEGQKSLGVIPSAIFHQPTAISLYKSQQTPHPAALINKSAFESVGGYRVQDFPAEDISLWMRLAKVGECISIPKILLNYRMSAKSITGLSRNTAKEKTLSLALEIGVGSDNLNFCLENWQDIFDSFSSEELGAKRSLIMFRNISYAMKLKGSTEKQKSELKMMQFHLSSKLKYNRAFMALATQKVLRDVFRRI